MRHLVIRCKCGAGVAWAALDDEDSPYILLIDQVYERFIKTHASCGMNFTVENTTTDESEYDF